MKAKYGKEVGCKVVARFHWNLNDEDEQRQMRERERQETVEEAEFSSLAAD